MKVFNGHGYFRASTFFEYAHAVRDAKLLRERYGKKCRITKEKHPTSGEPMYVVWTKIVNGV